MGIVSVFDRVYGKRGNVRWQKFVGSFAGMV